MRVTTKGRCAVNALIDLALREAAGPVALATISARQQVSLSYLEQLFTRLRRDGIVVSTRGAGGGYALGRPSAHITVADIVNAVDDSRKASHVVAADCNASPSLWQRLDATMLQHMAAITLESLVGEHKAQSAMVKSGPLRRAIVTEPKVQAARTTVPNSVFAFGRSFAR